MRDKFDVRIEKLRERQNSTTLRVGNVDFLQGTASSSLKLVVEVKEVYLMT